MTQELVPYEGNPGVLMTRATDVAGVCREIVKRTAQNIKGRKYVRVEGWQSIAAAYGCVASSIDVQRIDGDHGGVRAIGELHRVSDGSLVARAEGFVGNDEPTWASRSEYAIRAMAQTRAISRVCRSAFAFVVVLIDANLSTTPAEEMPPDVDETQRIGKITGAQFDDLEALCKANDVPVEALLKQAGVKSIGEINADDFDGAVRWIKNPKRKAAATAPAPATAEEV